MFASPSMFLLVLDDWLYGGAASKTRNDRRADPGHSRLQVTKWMFSLQHLSTRP